MSFQDIADLIGGTSKSAVQRWLKSTDSAAVEPSPLSLFADDAAEVA
jgi:hypothetical protein